MSGGIAQIEAVAEAPLRAHRVGGHCGSSALRDLLEHHRLDFGDGALSEGEVFVLAGALSAVFGDYGDLGMYLLGRSYTLEADLCAHLGVGCEQRTTEDGDLAWTWVKDEIDRGRPVMVWADIGHLDYLDVRMHNSNHDVIVVGYDLSSGEALMADHALPGVQRCGLASLAAARASHDFPGPHGNRTWLMDWPGALPPAAEAIPAAVHRGAGHVLNGEPALPYRTGLDALTDLASSMDQWGELDEPALKDRMRRLWFCSEKAGTGGGFFRGLWADGLHSFAELLDDPELGRLAALYTELAGEWTAMATEGLRRDRREALRSATTRIAHVVRLEEEGARGLAEWSRPRLIDTQATGEAR